MVCGRLCILLWSCSLMRIVVCGAYCATVTSLLSSIQVPKIFAQLSEVCRGTIHCGN